MKFTLSRILSKGEYFGRLLAAGLISSGDKIFLLYGITGRSLASRSRRLSQQPEGIFTEPVEEAALSSGKKELLIYPAILFSKGIAASNGQQTKDIAWQLARDLKDPIKVLQEALVGWDYEPDAPTFTPRISACFTSEGRLAMSLIRRGENGQTLREYYPLTLNPGEGYLITTYRGANLSPPPAFCGPPLELVITGVRAKDILHEFYEALAPKKEKEDLRVAAGAITCSFPEIKLMEIEIINRY